VAPVEIETKFESSSSSAHQKIKAVHQEKYQALIEDTKGAFNTGFDTGKLHRPATSPGQKNIALPVAPGM
jgi:hypothetical protein